MTDAPAPLTAETQSVEAPNDAPRVKVLLTLVEGSDFDAAVATVSRQVYDPVPDLVIVGKAESVPDGAEVAVTLEEAIAAADQSTDYLWILHSDARPRPDALSALVEEVERADAALGGSKLLVAGSHDVLESIGSATDVFGEPYTGLDEDEIDLQQYDVVREVSFVSSASMLVRRDLAQGLGGLDEKVPPVAAGLDFSQRARLAGGRVISVPSSEVYHQGRCGGKSRKWREQAGRLRAMVTAYSPLTLLWVLPYDFLVALVDSLVSLLFLRWRPGARHLMSWGWNTLNIPSTFGRRRRFKKVRVLGDEELFRFQARGSVRLRVIGSELSNRMLSIFDEDQALAKRSRRIWGSPGIWGAVLAVFILGFSMRSIIFSGLPNVAGSFPFEAGSVALERWFAGWNESGLGSPDAVHPSVGLTGLASILWFGAEGAARTVLTLAFGLLAVVGMGRFAGRLGLRGPGRYLAGLVVIAGPGTAVLAGSGSWTSLAAASVLPWAVRAAFVHESEKDRSHLSRFGWVILIGLTLASLSPVLILVPVVVVLAWKVWGGQGSRLVLALSGLLGTAVALQFFYSDVGWLLEADRRIGLSVDDLWPVLLVVGFLPLVLLEGTARRIGSLGVLLGLAGLLLVRIPGMGPGIEEASLILASFGAAMVVAAGLDRLTGRPKHLMSIVAAGAILFFSIGSLADGRLGLPSGDLSERLGFSVSLAHEHGPGRTLLASTQRSDVPGEARSGPGYWYRVVDGTGMTHDEVWLPSPRDGDEALDEALRLISTGSELRPGEVLAPFAIDWVVLFGPEFRLDEVLVAQFDLVPTPLDPDSRVFENPQAVALADAGADSAWQRSASGFSGDLGSGRVALALNHSDGWSPQPGPVGWQASVSAAEGVASFRGDSYSVAMAWVAVAVALLGLILVIVGRARR
ncbi:MAG: glycosyltransferase [Actinomycetota bacterium]|nr:glycosyltransferase [Actinomycetota bacterium]